MCVIVNYIPTVVPAHLSSSNSVFRTQRSLIEQSGDVLVEILFVCKLDFFLIYKTSLKSEEQYFLPAKNRYSVCPEVISE